MSRKLILSEALAGVSAAALTWLNSDSQTIAQKPSAKNPLIEFTSDGKAKQPVGYRKCGYLGTPVTPNDMNDGEANFPEFHNRYMDPESFSHVEQTGEYRCRPQGVATVNR